MKSFFMFLCSIMCLSVFPLSVFADTAQNQCWIKLKLNTNSNYQSVAANYVNMATNVSTSANVSKKRPQRKKSVECGTYSISATGQTISKNLTAAAVPVGTCQLRAGQQTVGSLTVTFPDDFQCN